MAHARGQSPAIGRSVRAGGQTSTNNNAKFFQMWQLQMMNDREECQHNCEMKEMELKQKEKDREEEIRRKQEDLAQQKKDRETEREEERKVRAEDCNHQLQLMAMVLGGALNAFGNKRKRTCS